MVHFKTLLVLAISIPLLAACSDAPSASTVEGLIEDQYQQANSMMEGAMSQAGDDEMAKAVGSMMAGMMPTLENVSDVNCDAADGKDTYRCTASITHSIGGNSQTNSTNSLVYKVNDEWALGN
ncbi:hypothetical protein R0I52_04825 [Psychrobacter sp. CAM01]|uniref:hypothetical protein n=1 Tax=Psychrobacter sp. CAM01 TaxID=3080335 RepID=UPI0029369731|nr:hypothetical protein [Psychrobacter sp. CAM01]MDV2860033.1 hypothetical protein [Psychrobacter sp. CAM01]